MEKRVKNDVRYEMGKRVNPMCGKMGDEEAGAVFILVFSLVLILVFFLPAGQ